MTDGSPNHAYKVGHAAGRAAGIRLAMSAIANLPTGKSEDVMEGQEQAYRAIEDLLLSLADGPPALPAVTPAPVTLAAALALPEVKALVEAAKPYISVVQNADYARQLRQHDALVAALAALEKGAGE